MVSRRQSVGVRRSGPAERHQADIDQSIKAVVDGAIRVDQTFLDVHHSEVRMGKGGAGRGEVPRGALGQIDADAALIDAHGGDELDRLIADVIAIHGPHDAALSVKISNGRNADTTTFGTSTSSLMCRSTATLVTTYACSRL
jgi:hypothetical protein